MKSRIKKINNHSKTQYDTTSKPKERKEHRYLSTPLNANTSNQNTPHTLCSTSTYPASVPSHTRLVLSPHSPASHLTSISPSIHIQPTHAPTLQPISAASQPLTLPISPSIVTSVNGYSLGACKEALNYKYRSNQKFPPHLTKTSRQSETLGMAVTSSTERNNNRNMENRSASFFLSDLSSVSLSQIIFRDVWIGLRSMRVMMQMQMQVR